MPERKIGRNQRSSQKCTDVFTDTFSNIKSTDVYTDTLPTLPYLCFLWESMYPDTKDIIPNRRPTNSIAPED
jgi:hypothetical protein